MISVARGLVIGRRLGVNCSQLSWNWKAAAGAAAFSTTGRRDADFTHAVIGAGVVGLAIARQLAAREGTSTILLERNEHVGMETSSRNSEVIHAGLYYGHDTLKTTLCIKGREMLYDLCQRNQIPHRQTGKWILAQNREQMQHLTQLHDFTRAMGDGAVPTRFVALEEGKRREPDVLAREGILESPRTGIVDVHSLMMFLLGEFEDRGGDVAYRANVTGIEPIRGGEGGYMISTGSAGGEDATSITAETLVNSAGHGACAVNNMLLPPERHITPYYAKGTYFSYSASRPKPHTLLYPAPSPGAGGLGTHLTLDMAGRVRFGPDVEWVDSEHDLTPHADRMPAAIAEIVKYLPTIDTSALAVDYCGIRPKLGKLGAVASGEGFQDFVVRKEDGLTGFVNLLGIESPGLTSALAIAGMVEGLLYK